VKQGAYTESLVEYDKEAQEKRKDLERELGNDISNIVQTESGKRFIWWLLSMSGVHLPSYTGNSDTYFNEGRRAIGLEILHRLVAYSPGTFEQMIRMGGNDK
jgi:hypothetical protein